MQFLGKVSRIYAHILLDIHPSHCYLSSSHVKCISLYVVESNDNVVLGNRLKVKLKGSANVHVKI
jgi:hypothetical protein